jgi:hypothetical protein
MPSEVKKLQDSDRILQLNLRIQLRLIFDYHTLNRTMLLRPSVINTNPLAGSQWRCHSLPSGVNDVRRRAESETYRALLASDDDRLTRLIGSYRTGLVSRSGLCRRCWSGCCGFFGRGRAGLCKRQRCSQPADQSNNCLLHSDASLFDYVYPQSS